MHSLRTLAVGLLIAGLASAQNNQNLFEIYPEPNGGSTTFTSRLSVGVNNGETLAEIPAASFKGVGDNGVDCRTGAIRIVEQDQNGVTQDQYYLISRLPNPSATPPGPMPGAAGANWFTNFIPMPASTTIGPVAWIITVTFAQPSPTVPCEGGWFLGVGHQAAPGWAATDGCSTHMADNTQGTLGDNGRTGAPRQDSWYGIGGYLVPPTYSPASTARSMRIAALNGAPTLNQGGLNPNNTRQPAPPNNFGLGGLFPDVSGAPRSDGALARLVSLQNAGGIALILGSAPGFIPGGIVVPGIGGRLWISPSPLFVLAVAPLSTAGATGDVTIAPPGSLAGLGGASFGMQALVLDSTFTTFTFSNEADYRW